MARVGITRWWSKVALVAAALVASWPATAGAQEPEDRADPGIVVEEEEAVEAARPQRRDNGTVTQAESRDVMTPAQTIVAGAIRIDGATALPQAYFAPSIEPYLGRTLAPADLRALARDVGNAARRAGYGLATAWIPRQSVSSGVLHVRLDEGRIDAVEATGPAGPAVERLLRRLTGGAPVRTADLERQLLLAGDLAGVSLGRARLDRRGDRNILKVNTEYQAVRGRASIDNWGTDAIGPVRARLLVEANGLATFGDRLTLTATVTPLQPRELQLVQAAYSLPIGADGTEATLTTYRSNSSAGGRVRARDLDGDSVEIEAGLSHPLVRSRAESLWAHATFGIRDSELTRADRTVRDDRIVTVAAILHGRARMAGGLGRTRVQLVQGLDALGATERGDPMASRDDAGGAFTKLKVWADFVRPLGRGFSVEISGEGQIASKPLLASEEMGLGGRLFLRGYDYREFAGDRGIAGGAELRYDLPTTPQPIRRAQVYVYGDAGRVENLRGGFGGGSLASAGGGVRLAFDPRLDAGLEVGVPLARGFDGRRPDPRISFTFTTRF